MQNHLKQNQLHTHNTSRSSKSAHLINFSAYTGDPKHKTSYIPWIFKHNKHEGQKGREASMLEVLFSSIASLFIKPGLTADVKLVVADNEFINQSQNSVITGVASQNINTQLKKQIDTGHTCYKLNINAQNQWTYTPITFKQDDIVDTFNQLSTGVHFLDTCQKNFFH